MKTRIRGYAFLLLCFAFTSSFAIQVGYFNYRGYLGNANGDTMKVNDTMVAMSNNVYVKAQTIINSYIDTPSVFFIIDNSGSMGYQNGSKQLSDSNGYRFKVANALIDTIYKYYPSAQVGFCAFDSGFCFTESLDTTVMRTCPAPYNTAGLGAYVRLLTLNGSYEGTTGLALVHKYLRDTLLPLPPDLQHEGQTTYDDLVYDQWPPSSSRGATNITLGFEAVKNAMLQATHPKRDQYVIFQSDGAADCCGSTEDNYENHVDSVPTTFTVFFNSTTVPNNLMTMTDNIRANGYSTSNPKSNYWPFQVTTFSSLLTLLMNNVYSVIQGVAATPTQIIIGTDTVRQWVDSAFMFNGLFPLTGAVTPFTSKITYDTYIDSQHIDSTLTINFYADRVPAAIINPDSFNVWRWDRLLVFRYNGVVIPAVSEYMDSLELRFGFSPGTANYSYNTVQVQLTTRVPPTDSEFYTMSRIAGTDTFSVKFKNTMSSPPVKGDGILEYKANDTIVAIFRNQETPKLPLDTLRIVCPIQTMSALPRAVIQIITPASQRVAGQPIKGTVTIQDSLGNTMDTTMVFNTASGGGAYYADTLGPGGKPAPFLIADGDTVMLDHISPDSCSETFTNGVDTIYFTLYNAPPDSDFIVIPHQISVSLKGSGTATPITGVSPPFKLYPGPIAGLQIQTADGTPIYMDTLNNATKPFNTYFSRGYDQYGNLFGTMNSNWHVTGSLHAPTVDTIGQGSVYYSAASDSENGYLVAIYDTAYSDSSVHAYSDSVYIIIKPSSATLVTAITRNWDGTGYLDHFDLIFSRKVQLPTDSASIAAFAAAVKITSPDPLTTISVKGIVIPALPSDSIWTVTLNNNHPDSVLQTGWKPDVTMLSFSQADIGATPAIIAQDGAGPVIARAIKQKLSNAGNTHDQVTVTFSEQLRSVPQNGAPSGLLDVWVKDSAGRYVKDSTLLSGIPGPLAPATDDTQAVFFMTNDSNITLGHYYVSIDSASSWANVQLCDLYGNRPDSNNRKVLVTFNSSVSGPLVISPNPMRRPGTVNGSPHLVIQDNSNNISDPVSSHGGGVKMTFDVPVPSTGDTGITVQAAVAIYDIVGNLVISGQNSRFIYYNGSQWIMDNGGGGESIADLVGTGTIVRPSIYWSGENGRGMTVAPGVYRGVVALHYAGRGTASYGDQRSSANIGVMHAAR